MTLLPLSRAARPESVPLDLAEPAQSAGGVSAAVHRLSSAYTRTGLLLLMSAVALLGGLLLQSVRTELPFAYTWLQPLRALKQVGLLRHFPLLATLAYVVGVLSRVGLAGAWSWSQDIFKAGAHRQGVLLRAFAFLAVFGLDVVGAPAHSPADALALACLAACLARPWSKAALAESAGHAALAALVFVTVCYWFTVIKALTFVGVQARDPEILRFENALFGGLPHRWVAAWAAQHPLWLGWLDRIYFRIFEHMALTTALLVGIGSVRARTEYLGALAICYFVGAPLYLLFPAAGPVYFDPDTFRFLQGHDLLVNRVQAALFRNTGGINEGRATVLHTWAYIACMPSLHMAHELVMLWFVRVSKPALLVSLGFTALTSVAVVALGWHYPTDVVAGAALAVLAILLARWQSARLLPRTLASRTGAL